VEERKEGKWGRTGRERDGHELVRAIKLAGGEQGLPSVLANERIPNTVLAEAIVRLQG
jgi:hypothetical protein